MQFGSTLHFIAWEVSQFSFSAILLPFAGLVAEPIRQHHIINREQHRKNIAVYISSKPPASMAPPSADTQSIPQANGSAKYTNKGPSASKLSGPLKYTGSLDEYESFDLTAAIGREFSNLQVSKILHDDTKIRDLGVLGQSHSCKIIRANVLTLRSVSAWSRVPAQPGPGYLGPEDPGDQDRTAYGQTRFVLSAQTPSFEWQARTCSRQGRESRR